MQLETPQLQEGRSKQSYGANSRGHLARACKTKTKANDVVDVDDFVDVDVDVDGDSNIIDEEQKKASRDRSKVLKVVKTSPTRDQ